MSMTISRAEGVTVYTIHPDTKSKWPLFCQLLGTLCYSPVCSVSLRLKQQLGCALTSLATTQIMVGIMNLCFGGLTTSVYALNATSGPAPFWLGGMFVAIGLMCILAEKFPSSCLVVLTVVMNIVSAGLAIAAIVLYSMDLAQKVYDWCPKAERPDPRYSWTTPSPAKKAEWDAIFEKQLEEERVCKQNILLAKTVARGLDIMLIVLAALQLCVSISWCVLSMKALCKKTANRQDVENPELCKPLMDEDLPNPEC